MSSPDKTPRSWEDIAAEAAREPDPDRLLGLVKELIVALEEPDKTRVARKPVRPAAQQGQKSA